MSDPYKRRVYQRNRRVVLEAAQFVCWWPGCRRPATTADHIVPLVRGGSHHVDNLRAACWHHNSRGGAQITNEIREQRKVGRRSRSW